MRAGIELRSDWSKSKLLQNPIPKSPTGFGRRSVGRGNSRRTHCRLAIEIQWELVFDQSEVRRTCARALSLGLIGQNPNSIKIPFPSRLRAPCDLALAFATRVGPIAGFVIEIQWELVFDQSEVRRTCARALSFGLIGQIQIHSKSHSTDCTVRK